VVPKEESRGVVSLPKLVGRFRDGRWVWLVRKPRRIRITGALSVVDTPVLLAGNAREAPKPFWRLAPRLAVDVGDETNQYRVDLADVEPRTAAVCDSGVVVFDESGYYAILSDGRQKRPFTVNAHRAPMTSSVRSRAVEHALHGVPAGAGRVAAEGMLLRAADLIKHVLWSRPSIDVLGNLWLTEFDSSRTKYSALTRTGSIGRSFLPPKGTSPLSIGREAALFVRAVAPGEDPQFLIGKIPKADESQMGYCSGAFVF
jgi:hypothetical protein